VELVHLRALVSAIKSIGEKGMTITRFKGLGEMDPEELWDTTLDPAKRTFAKVTLNDAIQAEKMFRMLMGDDVEGRREYILKNRIASIDDIDYGA
jgi:DNA gyrase subunit B